MNCDSSNNSIQVVPVEKNLKKKRRRQNNRRCFGKQCLKLRCLRQGWKRYTEKQKALKEEKLLKIDVQEVLDKILLNVAPDLSSVQKTSIVLNDSVHRGFQETPTSGVTFNVPPDINTSEVSSSVSQGANRATFIPLTSTVFQQQTDNSNNLLLSALTKPSASVSSCSTSGQNRLIIFPGVSKTTHAPTVIQQPADMYNKEQVPSTSNDSRWIRQEKLHDGRKSKRIVTGYILFATEIRRSLIAANPDLSFRDISRLVGAEWRNLPVATKTDYEEQALKQNAENQAQFLSEKSMPHSLAYNQSAADKNKDISYHHIEDQSYLLEQLAVESTGDNNYVEMEVLKDI